MDSTKKRHLGLLAVGSVLLLAGCGQPENQDVTTVGPDGDPGYELEDLEGDDFSELAGNPLTADVDGQESQAGGPAAAQAAGDPGLEQQPGSTARPGDQASGQPNDVLQAVAVMSPVAGSNVRGTVLFTQQDGGILVETNLTGLEAGEHGFHVHEFGDCGGENAANAGEHWNPFARQHGDPNGDPGERHVGDLGNVQASEQGTAEYEHVDQVISFEGENGILGKALIVHMMRDDLMTQPSGDSGDPVACGVIEAGANALTQDGQQPAGAQNPDNV